PFPILQKLVGHSRLLMTLYYTKPGASHVRDVLLGAAERLEVNKEVSIQNFLFDTEHDELLQKAICNSVPSLAAAIPQHPAARNPAGWMPMHHGLCLVGGNTSEVEDNGSVGGCYNGGPNLGPASAPKCGPVPGGSRNCVRCRWFVTEPHHLPALAAHFNTLAYHFDEARNACLTWENELQDLKKQKADAEDAGRPFARLDAYRQAERVWESAMKRFSDLAEDLVACWRLIERCKAALEAPHGDGTQLVAAGTVGDVHVGFEETESELLQLAGVCENVEVYPDLEPGKAVFRRSQLLDAVLYRDDLPPVFMLLSEQEQLLAGNAFMCRLAQQMNPANPALGQRQVIRLMDAGVSLSQHFDIDLAALLPTTSRVRAVPAGHQALTGDEA
ncbi:integrase, partial [Cupriavidus necator]